MAHEPIPKCILPEVEVFLGEVPIAVYETPGDQQFADTIAALRQGLQHHHPGQPRHRVTFGPDLEKAYCNTEIIDAYCESYPGQAARPGELLQRAARREELLDLKKRLGYDDVRFHKEDCESVGTAASIESLH